MLRFGRRPAELASIRPRRCNIVKFLMVCRSGFVVSRRLRGRSLLKSDRAVDVSTGLAAVFMDSREQLSAFLRARVGHGVDGAEVEDILQELWVRCCEVDAACVANPRGYLFRMAHNLVLNRAREAARRRRRETDWGLDQDSAEAPEAERGLLARERLATIDAALRGVGERAAHIFRRYRIDGIDQRRIAAELNVSLSTVEKDLRAAYSALLELKGRSDAE
jgi:RNA polymerase sigma factor (sigma-70 family)